jgi:preprotein translocase subunit SecE
MAKREEEKKKRAEDPAEAGDLDTSSDRAEGDEEETAREGEDESEESQDDESEEEASASDEDGEDEDEDDKAAASDDGEEEDAPKSEPVAEEAKLADATEEEDDAPPAQLGAQRYVMSAFFFGALLFAYLLGRTIDGIWLNLATRDWLVEKVPVVAAVPDDDKAMYATIAGGVIALVMAIRTSRNPEVRQWSDDVSSELLKVKWPTRKEVYASTVVVLTTSAVAVVYLFLLDRFWGFVTNQIYGTGL